MISDNLLSLRGAMDTFLASASALARRTLATCTTQSSKQRPTDHRAIEHPRELVGEHLVLLDALEALLAREDQPGDLSASFAIASCAPETHTTADALQLFLCEA